MDAQVAGVEVALLDRDGVIVSVNEAWEQFAGDNGGNPAACGVGLSYLAVCAAAARSGDRMAAKTAAAIRAAVQGDLPVPLLVKVPCHSPDAVRWFDVAIASRLAGDGSCLGATVTIRLVEIPSAAGVLDERRLRGLIRVYAAVSGDLSLSTVLEQIVQSARELIGARYAALGVVGPNGTLEQFVQSGMSRQEVEQIGNLPEGRGVLGLLISDPSPLRMRDLGLHPSAAGFPAGHPPMGAFLGVPIRIGDDVFGNLYLTEPVQKDGFSIEDEQLAVAMATAAGSAVASARRFTESEQRRRWIAASVELTHRLLSDRVQSPLQVITESAVKAADAGYAALAAPMEDGRVLVRAASGEMSAGMTGSSWPLAGSLAERVLASGLPLLLNDQKEATAAAARLNVSISALMLVPVLSGTQALGVLAFGRAAGRPAFNRTELALAAAFSEQAKLALELIEVRADLVKLAVLEDKDRIAQDLHDHVIQELFATGMGLESLISRSDPGQADRLNRYVDSLNNVILRIRGTIFQLQAPRRDAPWLQSRILDVAAEHTPQLGYSPDVQLVGLLDRMVPPAQGDDVIAVIREALSNCARHAQASRVALAVSMVDQQLTLQVTDDGIGVGAPTRSSGLRNMRIRAEQYGGSLEITNPPAGGTQLTWAVPVQSA